MRSFFSRGFVRLLRGESAAAGGGVCAASPAGL